MFINDIFERLKFWKNADRIGPDIPYTHWMLYFKTTMLKLCKKKFRYFDDSAEFRPGAYAISCSNISIGKRVIIRPGIALYADPSKNGGGITIEDDVLLGPGVQIYTNDHKFNDPDTPIIDQGHISSGEVILKKGCWIGANSIILKGVIIGNNSVVGAGTVVTKSIPDRVVAVGNPIRIIRTITRSDKYPNL